IQGDFFAQVRVGFEALPARAEGFEKGLFPAEMSHPLNATASSSAGFLLTRDAGLFLKSVRSWSLGAGEPVEGLVVHTRLDAESQLRVERGRPAVYLRIERLGPHLFAACSPDGERWSYYPALTGTLPNVLQIGLLAESNAAEGCTVTFTDWKLTSF